jgi:hypothetical protein
LRCRTRAQIAKTADELIERDRILGSKAWRRPAAPGSESRKRALHHWRFDGTAAEEWALVWPLTAKHRCSASPASRRIPGIGQDGLAFEPRLRGIRQVPPS